MHNVLDQRKGGFGAMDERDFISVFRKIDLATIIGGAALWCFANPSPDPAGPRNVTLSTGYTLILSVGSNRPASTKKLF